MSDNRLLNQLIIEQKFLKDTSLLFKKQQSLNKFLLLSLNETNDHFNKILLNIIQRQNRLFNSLLEEKEDRDIQRQTLENLLNKILSNEHFLINKSQRIHRKLNTKKRKRNTTLISSIKPEQILISTDHIKQLPEKNDQESFQIALNASNDHFFKIYWRSMSSNNLFQNLCFINMPKTSTDTYLGNNINKSSLFNHCPTDIHWDFPKLEKIKRVQLRTTISETILGSSYIKTFVQTSENPNTDL